MSESRILVPSEMNPPLNPTLVTDEEGLHKLAGFFSRTSEHGFDLETNVVPKFTERKIRTMQFGDRNEQYVVDLLAFAGSTAALVEQGHRKAPRWAEPVLEVVRPALHSGNHLKVGVNLPFEYETSAWCLGLRPWNFWDCQEAERMFYQGKVGFWEKTFWGMEPLAERYLRLKISKDEQKTFDLETPLTAVQIDYAALDTRIPLAIRVGQLRTAEKLKVERAIWIENHAIPAFSEMRINGKKLDKDKWIELVESIEAEHVEHIKQLDTLFLPVVGGIAPPEVDLEDLEKRWRDEEDKEFRAQYRKDFQEARRQLKAFEKAKETYEGQAAINYGSSDQLLEALKKFPGLKAIKGTSKKVLARYSDKEVVQAVQAYRKSGHALKSFGRNWLEYIDPVTGRIHANHLQNGTETGRPSCINPNLYNIPKDKRYRKCFTADEGYSIITIDESGAELRIIAEMSGEQSWIDAFAHNWDMHSVIARQMSAEKWDASKGVNCQFDVDRQKCECPEHKKIRDGAKAVNFGTAYGKEAAALAEDLKVSLSTAETILKDWRMSNNRVQTFLMNSGNSAKMNLSSRTLSGRLRWFDKPTWEVAKKRALEDAEKFKRLPQPSDINAKYKAMWGSIDREGKNTPIQGSNADITKTAMGSGFDKNGKPFMWHLLPNYDVTLEDGTVKYARLINHVYDEFVVQCPDETAAACMEMIGDCIRRAGAEYMTKVVMEFEGKVDKCWTK